MPLAKQAPAAADRPDIAALPSDTASLAVLRYPDPRLRRRAIDVQAFDAQTTQRLRDLAERMLQLMREHKGVGLAAPQVGVGIRLFVMNSTGQPEDDRIYVNPRLGDPDGEDEQEEGCLSLPEINTPVLRSLRLRMRACDLAGGDIDETAEGFVARVWQHETDHLDGVLILDKMPPTVKMAHRKKLKELEEAYREAHPEPPAKAPAKKRRFLRRK